MKKYLLLTIFMLYGIARAQEVRYEEIVKVDSLTATQIIEKANVWALKKFNDYQKVLQYKDTTRLALKAGFQNSQKMGSYSFPMSYAYQLQIEAKTGRYRITIDNIMMSSSSKAPTNPLISREKAISNLSSAKAAESIIKAGIESVNSNYDSIEAYFKSLMEDIKASINTPKKDDW